MKTLILTIIIILTNCVQSPNTNDTFTVYETTLEYNPESGYAYNYLKVPLNDNLHHYWVTFYILDFDINKYYTANLNDMNVDYSDYIYISGGSLNVELHGFYQEYRNGSERIISVTVHTAYQI